jgi:hypothetical protein
VNFLALTAAITLMNVGTPPRLLHYEKIFSAPKNETAGGMIRALLALNTRGRVIHCDIVVPSTSARLDAAVCEWLSSAVAVPAKDVAGHAAYSALVVGVTAFNQDSVVTPVNADLSLAVNHLPKGSPVSVLVQATLAVDPTGKVTGCGTIVDIEEQRPLASAACQMAQRMTVKPVMDEAGMAVSSIQQLRVEFSAVDAPTQRTEKTRLPQPQSKFPMSGS